MTKYLEGGRWFREQLTKRDQGHPCIKLLIKQAVNEAKAINFLF